MADRRRVAAEEEHISQIPEEAARADRVVALHGGRIVLDGAPSEVFSRIDRLAEIGLAPPVAASIAARAGHHMALVMPGAMAMTGSELSIENRE